MCFGCREKEHFISKCLKSRNKEFSQQKAGEIAPKKVYYVQQQKENSEAVQNVALTDKTENQEKLPLSDIVQCYFVESNIELMRCSGENIYINNTKYLALRGSCSQITKCHTDIIPQEDIIPNEKNTVKGITKVVIKLPMAKVHIKSGLVYLK